MNTYQFTVIVLAIIIELLSAALIYIMVTSGITIIAIAAAPVVLFIAGVAVTAVEMIRRAK